MPILMSEKQIENRVVFYAKNKGWIVIKLNPQWHRGLPDRMFILPGGKTVFMEMKKPGGKPSPLQKYFISWMKDLGHEAHILDNYDDAIRILDSASLSATSDKDDVGAIRSRAISRPRSWKDLNLLSELEDT
jgi:hypothetical protein